MPQYRIVRTDTVQHRVVEVVEAGSEAEALRGEGEWLSEVSDVRGDVVDSEIHSAEELPRG